MIELTKNINVPAEVKSPSEELVQLRHISGESIFMTDPEGHKIEIKTTNDGTKVLYTRDESGKSIAIEERANATKLYHISKDSTGLPSTHEVRPDQTEIVYFYNVHGNLQHFVELKPNGDRISTLINPDGSIYSIEQKQIGGVIFKGWTRIANEPKEGLIWLHPDGDITTHGDKIVIDEIFKKFAKFLDGVVVETR